MMKFKQFCDRKCWGWSSGPSKRMLTEGLRKYTLFIYLFIFDVWYYLFVTLRTSHFWLDSDSEVEALREDSLRLLAICSCRFSLASFILLAKSLAYSAASSLFFLVRCFFRAICRCLCCRTRGVTRRWILGALVLGFLPSLGASAQHIGGHHFL